VSSTTTASVDSRVGTWDAAALTHINYVWYGHRPGFVAKPLLVDIRMHEDYLIDTYFTLGKELTDSTEWIRLAQLALECRPELDSDFVWRTLCSKQNDYGPDNIARFSHKGLILRLHDKVARLENLVANNRAATNEPVEDTYMDIIGYSIIGLMLLDGSFFLPMGYSWQE